MDNSKFNSNSNSNSDAMQNSIQRKIKSKFNSNSIQKKIKNSNSAEFILVVLIVTFQFIVPFIGFVLAWKLFGLLVNGN
jgi:hypothetical protein